MGCFSVEKYQQYVELNSLSKRICGVNKLQMILGLIFEFMTEISNPMKKVLVVDDNPDILHLVQIILKNNGFEVLASPQGDDVLDKTEKFSPQVILLDVFLSGYDGRDICRQLKQNSKTKDIPVIMFSAHTRKEEIIRDCNADDFIAKPFEVSELIQKLNRRVILQSDMN